MIISKSEAELRWCPFARMAYFDPEEKGGLAGINRSADDEPVCFCVASQCMAWVDDGVQLDPKGSYPVGHCGLVKDRAQGCTAASVQAGPVGSDMSPPHVFLGCGRHREALACSKAGATALLIYRKDHFAMPRQPKKVFEAVRKDQVKGTLFDLDARRLTNLATKLGVETIEIDCKGLVGQNVDLAGEPLLAALAMAGMRRAR